MKISKFNFFTPFVGDESKIIAYNASSNGGALMSLESYNQYLEFVERDVPIEDENLLQSLTKGLFLLEDDFDELEVLSLRLKKDRFNNRSMGLTIVPTSDCNFRCVYCYEKDVISPVYMSDEEQERILRYIENNMRYLNFFSITWYGGEPMLAFNIIEKMSQRIMELAKKYDVNYDAMIITNGYLLKRDIISKLKDLNISRIQVTLDGSEESHNKRRPLKGDKPTFEKIIKNLEDNYDILNNVNLRINMDKENEDSGEKILKLLVDKKIIGKITPYIARVTDDNDCYNSGTCITSEDFALKDFDYLVKTNEVLNIGHRYPKPKTVFCGADRSSSYVINADGKIYKCWCDIGYEDRAVGTNIESIDISSKYYIDYMSYDVTKDSKCEDCNILPICMGGCPIKRLVDASSDNRCDYNKFHLSKYLNHAFAMQIEHIEKLKHEKVSNL